MSSENTIERTEKETFAFSPLKPILLVVFVPAIYFWFTRNLSFLGFIYSPYVQLVTYILIYFLWKYLRVTFLMLTLKPAVVLTDKSITITEAGYNIDWTDVKDVFMSSSGGTWPFIPLRSYYITIRVREPEKYFAQIKNPFTRAFRYVTRNWRETGAFEVDLSLVRGDEDEIYHRVLRYYQNNRGF
ncbi:MAG TPA: hypothetical protein VHE59_00080 [Mucilaginibacter sp.]|nr:hypothetical protein [Mucilaginibacter sp.]